MSNISIKPGALTLPKFVKRLGYKSAQDREFNVLRKMLEKQGIIEIQQSGYMAHSKEHPKLIAIREALELDRYKHILEKLKVNFQIGDFTVHQTTKSRKCARCKSKIFEGELTAQQGH